MNLTACAAVAREEPVAAGSLSADFFPDNVTRWKAAGIRAVELQVPPSIRKAMADPAPPSGWLGADRLMLPAQWALSEEPARIPDLWCLRNARVFGGANVGRTYEPLPAGAEGWHWNGQTVLTCEKELIPASYGAIDGNYTLPRGLMTVADGELHLDEPAQHRFLEGTYVLLGNLQPHFGHALLEGLTRAWALAYLDPSMPVKWLVYEPRVSGFGTKLLAMAGIKQSALAHASPFDVVERLIVPDVGMRTHRWITSAQGLSWDRVSHPSEPLEQVFLSRADVPKRPCTNHDRVEEMFAKAGWRVVRPETLAIRDQIRLAGRARRLAGCAGSQMFLAAFQPSGGDNIVIAPENFVLRDDALISTLRGHHLEVTPGSLVDFRTSERRWAADLERVSAALHEDATVTARVTRRLRAAATTVKSMRQRTRAPGRGPGPAPG